MGVSTGATGSRVPLWNSGVPRGQASPGVRLSKIFDYLVDNLSCNRLSDLRYVVNDKARCGGSGC